MAEVGNSVQKTEVGASALEAEHGLPPGVKRWRQKKIRDRGAGGGPETEVYGAASFLVRHDDFLGLLGPNPQLEDIGQTDAHEGLVYYPDENAILFTTQGDFKSIPNKVKKFCLKTKEVKPIFDCTEFANGMTLDHQGNLLICQQGCKDSPAYIQKVNLKTWELVDVADNWFGRRFNGPNDIVVKSDESIWFTDPDYPREQGFGAEPQLKNHVYRIAPDGTVDIVADKFHKPNGLAFSPDESKLYVTDTGYYNCVTDVDINRPHSITVFDVVNGRQLGNRRLFAAICSFDGSKLGTPDGIKVDTEGRVYVGSSDGVHVISEQGVVLGLIRVPSAVNLGFGGPLLDTLYIFNDKAVQSVKLNAVGAGLPYAGKFHNIQYYTK